MHNPPALLAVPTAALADPNLASLPYDALVIVAPSPLGNRTAALASIAPFVEAAIAADAALGKGAKPPVVLPAPGAPGGRLVLATTSSLTDDTDDVRAVAEVVAAA